MRTLRAAAWAVFCLDLVILAQLVYELVAVANGPAAQASVRGLAMMLGSGLLGVAILLSVSTALRSAAGLWLSLACGAVPMLWVALAISRACGNDGS